MWRIGYDENCPAISGRCAKEFSYLFELCFSPLFQWMSPGFTLDVAQPRYMPLFRQRDRNSLPNNDTLQADARYAHPSQHQLEVQNLQPLNGRWNDEIETPGHTSYGYGEPSYRPPGSVDPLSIPGATSAAAPQVQSSSPVPISSLSAVERSKLYPRPPPMSPHLQFMCGPLLRYDTVQGGIWHGAIMIVTADAGSQYSPGPSVSLDWDPERPHDHIPSTVANGSHPNSLTTEAVPPFDFDPHYSGGLAPIVPQDSIPHPNRHSPSPKSHRAQSTTIPGQEIYVFHDTDSTFTFWRFMVQVPLADVEMSINYRVNGGAEVEFFVPALDQNMRWATYSVTPFTFDDLI